MVWKPNGVLILKLHNLLLEGIKMRKKETLVALVSPELKVEFQEVLLRKYGHVSNKMSSTIERIVRQWVDEQKSGEALT